MPDIGERQCEVFGKCPWAVDAHPGGVFAEMAAPSQAVAASSADHMAFAADNIADMKADGVGTALDNAADKLMPHHHRHRDGLLRPGVPIVNMQVGAADSGAQHLDQHLVDGDDRYRGVFQPQAPLGLALYQCLHGFHAVPFFCKPQIIVGAGPVGDTTGGDQCVWGWLCG